MGLIKLICAALVVLTYVGILVISNTKLIDLCKAYAIPVWTGIAGWCVLLSVLVVIAAYKHFKT
jgi:hypothetical protein